MNPEQPFARAGGRRFILALLSCLLYTALLVGGYIDQHVYFELQAGTVLLYIAGNGHQKWTEARYGNSDKPGTQ